MTEYKGKLNSSIPRLLGIVGDEIYELVCYEEGGPTQLRISGKNLAKNIKELGFEDIYGTIKGPIKSEENNN